MLRTTAIALLLLLTACQGSAAAPEPDSVAQPAAHESHGGEPGEAFCEEHGILEAVCTRCNPDLIPVFQAKGDFCAEHQLPESLCPICHPERGGRPAVEVGADEAPADGTPIKLATADAARWAGIETVEAHIRPEGATLQAVVRITYDATRHAVINARSRGVIRAIEADVGQQVKAGDTLALIESADVGADRSRLQAAASRVKVARANFEREQRLHKEGISATKDVLAARHELDAARAEHAAAQASLGVVGAGTAGRYTLTSPISGVVTVRTATIGHMTGGDEALFEVVDTSSMWGEVDVPEASLALVHVGQGVTTRLRPLGDRTFEGQIQTIAPSVDPHTRTARARVPLENADGVLRANMYGKADIALDGQSAVVVPRSAVQRAKGRDFVFVRQISSEFEARRVKTGARDGDHVVIHDGVRPGERVVTTGSFLLKTEILEGSIGAGCCE